MCKNEAAGRVQGGLAISVAACVGTLLEADGDEVTVSLSKDEGEHPVEMVSGETLRPASQNPPPYGNVVRRRLHSGLWQRRGVAQKRLKTNETHTVENAIRWSLSGSVTQAKASVVLGVVTAARGNTERYFGTVNFKQPKFAVAAPSGTLPWGVRGPVFDITCHKDDWRGYIRGYRLRSTARGDEHRHLVAGKARRCLDVKRAGSPRSDGPDHLGVLRVVGGGGDGWAAWCRAAGQAGRAGNAVWYGRPVGAVPRAGFVVAPSVHRWNGLCYLASLGFTSRREDDAYTRGIKGDGNVAFCPGRGPLFRCAALHQGTHSTMTRPAVIRGRNESGELPIKSRGEEEPRSDLCILIRRPLSDGLLQATIEAPGVMRGWGNDERQSVLSLPGHDSLLVHPFLFHIPISLTALYRQLAAHPAFLGLVVNLA
ncbi:hypothetical protein E2C01_034399 [Portunus trituberculatus]|uniref:Uncharacterized protein n=1 Tax=Portunus trituberculatus TaxID=210409 RepID=A0A5B7F0J6_PORTR|nr:hypothetical protein [Portunus trituberculatus]